MTDTTTLAPTPEQIDAAYRKVWSTVPHGQRLTAFAHEIAKGLTPKSEDPQLTDKQIEAAVAMWFMWFSEAPDHKNFNIRMRAAIDAAFKEKP